MVGDWLLGLSRVAERILFRYFLIDYDFLSGVDDLALVMIWIDLSRSAIIVQELLDVLQQSVFSNGDVVDLLLI